MKRIAILAAFVILSTTALSGGISFAQQAARGIPDLTIEKIYLTTGCNVAGVVKNKGQGSVPDMVWTAQSSESARIHLYRNGVKWGGANIWKFDPDKKLKRSGGTAAFVSNLHVAESAAIKVVIDSGKKFVEANEKNNSVEVTLTCKGQDGQSESTKAYWYDPHVVLPMWPLWPEIGVGGGTDPICERCILNCMGDHTYEYCRRMCERAGRCKPFGKK